MNEENQEVFESMESMEIVEKAKKYMEQKGISQWLKGQYEPHQTMDIKVLELLEKEEAREKLTETDVNDFAKTQISMTIWGLLDYIRKRRAVSMIYGDSGVGKTKSVVEWAKDKSDVILLTARPTLSTTKEIMKSLAEELKTKTTGTQGDIARGVIKKLKGTDKMIIVDEAQQLTIKAIDELRSLNDDLETRTTVVLVGNHPLYEKINKKEEDELVLLKNRMSVPLEVTTKQVTLEDIRKIFTTGDEEVLEILHKVSRTEEGIRGAVEFYTDAVHHVGGKIVDKKTLLTFAKKKKVRI